jgi:hypothetical protein
MTIKNPKKYREENPLDTRVIEIIDHSSDIDLTDSELIKIFVSSYIDNQPEPDENEHDFELKKKDAVTLNEIIENLEEAKADKNIRDIEKFSCSLGIAFVNSFLFKDLNPSTLVFINKLSTLKNNNQLKILKANSKKEKLKSFVADQLGNNKISNKELTIRAETDGLIQGWTWNTAHQNIKLIAAEIRKIKK